MSLKFFQQYKERRFSIYNRDGGEKGFAAYFLTILVMVVMLGILLSLALIIFNQQRIANNISRSNQAYLAAEAGVEDALLRIKGGMEWNSAYSLAVDGATAEIIISDPPIGGARTIVSEGSSQSRVRKVRVVYRLSSDDAAFRFGVHIGNPSLSNGGLSMDHNDSKVVGNVFANANISGLGKITGSATISGSGNNLSGTDVGLNVETYSCFGASTEIDGDLEYYISGTNTCDVEGSTTTTSTVISPINFPITPAMLSGWEAAAEAEGIVDGGGDVSIDENRSLGPGKITGNLTVGNGDTLTITGTLWVTGTFIPGNGAIIELDDGYDTFSGVLIADQAVDIGNLVTLKGSGSPGSFLAIVGTSASLDEGNSAIAIANNSDNAILFAPNGIVTVKNNANIAQVTAHKLAIKKATVTYKAGLANAKFIIGPSSGWEIASWQEIE